METSKIKEVNEERTKTILKQRADILKIPLEKISEAKKTIECLKFRLSKETYAIDSTYISEVILINEHTPLPCTPAFIIGIINVRGRIISIIDIKKFFNISDNVTNIHKVIVVKNNEIETGILADDIIGNATFDLNSLQTDITTITEKHDNHIIGVTKDCEIILDIKELLSDERILIEEEI